MKNILPWFYRLFSSSMRKVFTGVYIDGDRERIPYEGDAYINHSAGTVASMAVSQGKEIHVLKYEDFRKKLVADGHIPEY